MTMTKEEILKRMMDAVSSVFDKREGSVIHDALAPVAYELSVAYEELEQLYKNTFAGTADRDGLILRAQEIGLSPYQATYAVRKAKFTPSSLSVEVGSRFNYEDINFTVLEIIGLGLYSVQCETPGDVGNYGSGQLIPIDYIQGLEKAELLEDVLVYGEEEENTEDFRQRYFDSIIGNAIDGNIAQYEKWCRDFKGIGNFKILPLWNGANTVKVSILGVDNKPASDVIVNDFQNYLDPTKNGLGNGQAPIGAIVTVSTATTKTINVSATVTLKSGYTEAIGINEELEEFIKSIAYKKSDVNYYSIASIINENECIDTVKSVTLNGYTSNISLDTEQVAVLGRVDITYGV